MFGDEFKVNFTWTDTKEQPFFGVFFYRNDYDIS